MEQLILWSAYYHTIDLNISIKKEASQTQDKGKKYQLNEKAGC